MIIECPVHKNQVDVGGYGSRMRRVSGVALCGCVFTYHRASMSYSWCGDSSRPKSTLSNPHSYLAAQLFGRSVYGPNSKTYSAYEMKHVSIDISHSGESYFDEPPEGTMVVTFSGRKPVVIKLTKKMVRRIAEAYDSAERLLETKNGSK